MPQQYAIFSIGPVQSFIAAARKLEDLWGGSYLLSYLIESTIANLYAAEASFELIYPRITAQEIKAKIGSQDPSLSIAHLPNRITFTLDTDDEGAVQLLKRAELHVRKEIGTLCAKAVELVFAEQKNIIDSLQDQIWQQTEAFLEVYWIVQSVGQTGGLQRQVVETRFQTLKNQRRLCPHQENGLACTLYPALDALCHEPLADKDRYGDLRRKLENTWEQRSPVFRPANDHDEGELEKARIRNREYLCAISLVKRMARDIFQRHYRCSNNIFSKYESVVEIGGQEAKYYAVLLMDGDNMGQRFADGSDVQELSRRLSRFSREAVPEIVSKHKGILIYAGGDDVLALFPVNQVLEAADALRHAFASEKEGLGTGATSSTGIAIGHKTSPLQQALNQARLLEATAKSYCSPSGNEKNALAIAVRTRSGEHLGPLVLPWQLYERPTTEYLQEFIAALEKELSPTFVYRFAQAFQPFLPNSYRSQAMPQLRREIIETEYRRLVKRAVRKRSEIEQTYELAGPSFHFYDILGLGAFIDLLKILTFFNRRRAEYE
ncbi:type III-B CRISPR-associated protein Cas10/Cmr2 [Methylomusa anaerophila]|uniref:CRISPR-associated protein n=1 Tax=Methylomusa anaerophila TaxID=1930071 RepID=A0A348AQY9_9FIRM|nr:type III-B CRISPR-associated protein Cas10/Cmr2 [Methylomusa anaerophila]BBB93487.1 CRISPR-associated protein [Methylomusa anaerophila]